MAISRINFGFYFVAGVIQPIGNFVNPLAIFAYRVLITAYVVERKSDGNLLCPLRAGNHFHHLGKEDMISQYGEQAVNESIGVIAAGTFVADNAVIENVINTADGKNGVDGDAEETAAEE